MNCPHCGSPLAEGARFCGSCGSEIPAARSAGPAPSPRPGAPPPDPRPAYAPPPPVYGPPPAQPYYTPAPGAAGVPAAPEESYGFAIVTLVLYWFFWPAGVVCNIIGLVSGPRRGCFLAMALVGIGLPLLAAIVVAILAVAGLAFSAP